MRRLLLITAFLLAGIVLLPGAASAQGIISSLTVDPGAVQNGASAQGTVALAGPDAADTQVLVFSSDTSVATVPATVVVPAGATSATFPIATNAAAPATIVMITAWVGQAMRSANLSVNAATPAGPSLSAVSVSPSSLTGGSPATGTVTFSAAMTSGAVVRVSSSNPAVVQVPSGDVVVSAGKSTAAFPVTTAAVTASTTVTITATWFGITRSTTMTVSPGAPAAADVVRITRAEWSSGRLRIEATSTSSRAILTVHTLSGGYLLTLNNNGGGRYSISIGWVTKPPAILVKSSLGGSATATVRG
jgi:hypothetical protein